MSDVAQIAEGRGAAASARERLLRPRLASVEVDGETLHVRALGAGHLEPLASLLDLAAKDDVGASAALAIRFACYCLCDEAGNRLFADDELDQVGSIAFGTLDAIATAVVAISGLGEKGDDSGN